MNIKAIGSRCLCQPRVNRATPTMRRGPDHGLRFTVWDWKWTATSPAVSGKHRPESEVSMGRKGDDSTRPAILFDPTTGKMAGRCSNRTSANVCRSRRTTAVRHGWSRFTRMQTVSGPPSRRCRANRAVGACPDNANRKHYNIHFVRMPITLAKSRERAGHGGQGWSDLRPSRRRAFDQSQ